MQSAIRRDLAMRAGMDRFVCWEGCCCSVRDRWLGIASAMIVGELFFKTKLPHA